MKASVLTLCFCLFLFATNAQNKDATTVTAAPKVVFQNCLDKPLDPDFYKGKFLVLDFWATWCAPCIGGFPHFNQLADKYSSDKVLFASMTEEPVAIEQKFFTRTQKQLHAFKLSDTTKSTFNSFNIATIPHCYVIGPDNMVRWEGATYDLTADVLDKILRNQMAMPVKNVSITTHVSVSSKDATRPLLYFSVAEADASSKIKEGMGSSSALNGIMLSYRSPKVLLNHFLQELTGFAASSRILTNDTIKLKKAYAIEFSVGQDSNLYKGYTNAVFPKSARENYILSTIGSAARFDARVEKNNVKHFELVITDTAKLHSFQSMQSHHSSWDDDHLPQLEITGHSLKDIINLVENFSKTIISMDGLNDKNPYDLSLNVANIDSLKKSLKFYGLGLKEVNSGVDFLNINFY